MENLHTDDWLGLKRLRLLVVSGSKMYLELDNFHLSHNFFLSYLFKLRRQ